MLCEEDGITEASYLLLLNFGDNVCGIDFEPWTNIKSRVEETDGKFHLPSPLEGHLTSFVCNCEFCTAYRHDIPTRNP